MRIVGQRSRLTVEHFLLMRIPRRFWGITFDQIEPDLKEVVRNYLQNLDMMLDNGHGFLFAGNNGVGKTSAACFIAREVRRTGASVLMITAASLIESVLEKTEVEEGLLLDRTRIVDFLLLDDLGHEHSSKSKFEDRVLENLLRERGSACLTTFITTNMSIEDLKERYETSMLEVMKEMMLPVVVEGKNYRDEAWKKLSETFDVGVEL